MDPAAYELVLTEIYDFVVDPGSNVLELKVAEQKLELQPKPQPTAAAARARRVRPGPLMPDPGNTGG